MRTIQILKVISDGLDLDVSNTYMMKLGQSAQATRLGFCFKVLQLSVVHQETSNRLKCSAKLINFLIRNKTENKLR